MIRGDSLRQTWFASMLTRINKTIARYLKGNYEIRD